MMGDRLGLYGKPEMIRTHGEPQIKYLTEYLAAAHIFDSEDPRFIPPADVPSLLYCCRCRDRKPHNAFDVDARYTMRACRRTECKACRAKERKQQRLSRRQQKHQPPVMQTA